MISSDIARTGRYTIYASGLESFQKIWLLFISRKCWKVWFTCTSRELSIGISKVTVPHRVFLHVFSSISGANLLTNKDGTVKLADFGVASKSAAVNDNAVVGSPYWSLSPSLYA